MRGVEQIRQHAAHLRLRGHEVWHQDHDYQQQQRCDQSGAPPRVGPAVPGQTRAPHGDYQQEQRRRSVPRVEPDERSCGSKRQQELQTVGSPLTQQAQPAHEHHDQEGHGQQVRVVVTDQIAEEGKLGDELDRLATRRGIGHRTAARPVAAERKCR